MLVLSAGSEALRCLCGKQIDPLEVIPELFDTVLIKDQTTDDNAPWLGRLLKSAWFMWHRIREAMRKRQLLPAMGGKGSKIAEADETFIGSSGKRRPTR